MKLNSIHKNSVPETRESSLYGGLKLLHNLIMKLE